MKQNITVTQLQELSDTARDKLTFYLESTGTLHGDYRDNDFCEHVNIGQMIEFLDDHKRFYTIGKSIIRNEFVLSQGDGVEYIDIELCDVLFEAVKKLLEEKDR